MGKIYIIDTSHKKISATLPIFSLNPEERFIYSTTYLSELDMILESCSAVKIYDQKDQYRDEMQDFLSFVDKRENICTTHSFINILSERILHVKSKGYCFIIDECPFLIHNTNKGLTLTNYTLEQEIQAMKELHLIKIDYQNRIHWIDQGYRQYMFIPYKNLIEARNVYYIDGELIWYYPPKYLQCFDKVYIMTSTHKEQLKKYLNMYQLSYEEYIV